MKKLVVSISLITIISCGKTREEKPEQKTAAPIAPKTVVLHKSEEWYNDLIENYIANTKNELIIYDRKSKQIDWVLDNTEVNDTANYYIFNIGHTETDNGENPRFTSDGWIYIDSLSKNIYEYDLPKEKLILWKNK